MLSFELKKLLIPIKREDEKEYNYEIITKAYEKEFIDRFFINDDLDEKTKFHLALFTMKNIVSDMIKDSLERLK